MTDNITKRNEVGIGTPKRRL